jgi:hypothetical protein
MPRRPDLYAGTLLVGLSVLLWLPRFRGPIDLRYDAGVYYILGTSLAEGKGYRLLNEPGDIEAVQYPPLLPAIVAAHQAALGTADPATDGRALRLSFFVLFTLYLLAAHALARQHLGPRDALLVAVVCGLSAQSVFMSDLLFAEVPFALVATLFAVFNRRCDRTPCFVLTAVLGAAAFLLRTAGVALLAAWVVESLAGRKWKQALARVTVAAVPLVGWQAYVGHVTASEGYRHPAYAYQRAAYQFYNVPYSENVFLLVDPFTPERGRATAGDIARRFGENLAVLPVSLGEGVTVGPAAWRAGADAIRVRTGTDIPAWVLRAPAAVVGCLVLAGALRFLTRKEWFIPAYLATSAGLMCLTPWPAQFPRYLVPLTPFLTLCLVCFLRSFGEYTRSHASGKWRRVGAVTFATMIGLVIGLVLGTNVCVDLYTFLFRHAPAYSRANERGGRLFYYDRKWEEFDAALAWLSDQGEPGGVVATTAPHWAYLKTGRKAVMPPLEKDPARAQELLDSVPVTYLIVDELEFLDVGRRYGSPVVEAYPRAWRLVYPSPGRRLRVYERTH